MRKIFIGGNWKCNNNLQKSLDLVKNVYNKISYDPAKVEVLISPISLHLSEVRGVLANNVILSAQNVSRTETGAYTGEIAPSQLKDFGIHWSIIGHSERRELFGDCNQTVADKTGLALDQGLSVVLCVGEKKEERETGKTEAVLTEQLEPVWEKVGDRWDKVVIAYEPVWAIGTGLVASPEQAQDTHAFIRKLTAQKASQQVADKVRILYGGSVKSSNCEGLIKLEDIDGFLVGGASLSDDIKDIVEKSQAAL